MNAPTLEPGYRFLTVGETLSETDEFWVVAASKWVPTNAVGSMIRPHWDTYRRKIETPNVAAEEMRQLETRADAARRRCRENQAQAEESGRQQAAQMGNDNCRDGRTIAEQHAAKQSLFDHMASEHGLTLLDSELNEIRILANDEAKRMEAIDQAHNAALELAAHTAKRDWQDKTASQIERLAAQLSDEIETGDRLRAELDARREGLRAALAILRAQS